MQNIIKFLMTVYFVHFFSGKVQTSPSGRSDEQFVERYQSVAEFTGGGRGEMSLKENEVVTVIEKNNTGL